MNNVPLEGKSSHGEVTGMDHDCLETISREILRVQGNDEIGLALLGAKAEWIILGIGRNLNRGMHIHLLGSLADQVDDFPDQIWADTKALQDLLILIQDNFCYEPDKIVLFRPSVKHISTRIPARNKRLSEAGNASNKHARVNNSAWLALPSSPRQL